MDMKNIMRVEGIVTTKAISNLTKSIETIYNDMIEEGYEKEDVCDYIETKVASISIIQSMIKRNKKL